MDITERVEQLEKKVAELERQLQQLRLSGQSGGIESGSHVSSRPADAESVKTGASGAQSARPSLQLDSRPARERLPARTPIDWEHLLARVWLPRVFIVVLLIGVLWGFTAAVNAGFITEPLRCLIGAAAAIALYVLGEKQMRHSRHALGQVLLGGSAAVMLLSLFAAHMLYDLLPAWLAFIAYVATVSAGLWLAVRYRSQALVIIMIIAGYLLPFLVDTAHPSIWSLAVYEALFSSAMLVLSHRLKFRAAFICSFGVLHLSLLIGWLIVGELQSRSPVLAAVLFQHAVMFVLSAFKLNRPKEERSVVSLLVAFGLAAAWGYGLYEENSPDVYRSVIAVAAILYSATGYWQVRKGEQGTVCLSVATFAWFLLLVDVLDVSHTAAPTLIEGTIAIILGMKLRSALQRAAGGLVYLFGAGSVLTHPIRNVISTETLGWVALLGTIAVLYAYLRRTPAEGSTRLHTFMNSLLWAGSILILMFITQITDALTVRLSDNMQHLLLSAVWVAYAIAVIVLGVVYKRKKVRLAGLLFLFISLLKIIFIDLPDVSTVVRALLFIGVGTVGIAASRLFYKRKG